MTASLATIVKDGKLINIEEDHLHKGDLVVLQTADIVPADLRLIEANGLELDEFEITGEILPVTKKVDGEDEIILYMGSRVMRGTGKGIVVATGEQTEYGKVLKEVWEQDKPYQFRLAEKKHLALILLLLLAFMLQAEQSNHIFGLVIFYSTLSVVLLLSQNDELHKQILVSSELTKLERLGIQIRDRKSLKQMGDMDILCFDKTGVLTTRQMEVKSIVLADGASVPDTVQAIDEGALHWIQISSALCNDVMFFEKLDVANPIDKALISFALKNGIDVNELLLQYKRVYDKPFDSENRYMISGFEKHARKYYFAKGDPEVILRMCNRYMTATGGQKESELESWRSSRLNMGVISQRGDVAIAMACSNFPTKDYTFLCLVQLENPLQFGVREIIQEITEKGIRSILLTGDRAETAVKVAEECGIMKDSKTYLIGRTIDRMESSEIARQSAYCSVFARLLPSQKSFLIRLLQQTGHVIGMVGDGVNDGIALKAADIGISFVNGSSPLARRLAKILINDLADLLRLVESANWIKRRDTQLRVFRVLIMAGSLLCIYLWILVPRIYGR